MCHEQAIDPFSVYGSYAGAIGQPQFMPSSYRAYAVDFSGNGKSDLRASTQDVIASVANYFSRHGWQYHAPIASPAQINGNHYKKLNLNAKKATYSITRLKTLGIKSKEKTQSKTKKVGLVELKNPDKNEYWLAYPNFYVITRYNTSKQYATVVHLLAQKIKSSYHTPKQAA